MAKGKNVNVTAQNSLEGIGSSPNTQDLRRVLSQVLQESDRDHAVRHDVASKTINNIDVESRINAVDDGGHDRLNVLSPGLRPEDYFQSETFYNTTEAIHLDFNAASHHPAEPLLSPRKSFNANDIWENQSSWGRTELSLGSTVTERGQNNGHIRNWGNIRSKPSALDIDEKETRSLQTSRTQPLRMDDYESPLPGSDASALSATQVVEYAEYERIRHGAARGGPLHELDFGFANVDKQTSDSFPTESSKVEADTAPSYNENDTGHVTLAIASVTTGDPGEELDSASASVIETGENALVAEAVEPKTPMQPKLPMLRPGTLLGPSQLFAATQGTSSAFRAQRPVEPSSDRPSVGDFTYGAPNLASSPSLQRVPRPRVSDKGSVCQSSSPVETNNHDLRYIDYHDKQVLGEPETFTAASFIYRNAPEPRTEYMSRKQSQERRQLLEDANLEHDNTQASVEDFIDIQAQQNRRAKLKKQNAIHQLAKLGVSTSPCPATMDLVEVPSTSNGRRRSCSEVYIAQCSGEYARDTQPSQQDYAVADSQGHSGHAETELETGASRPRRGVNNHILVSESFTNQIQSPEIVAQSPEHKYPEIPVPLRTLDNHIGSAATSSLTEFLGSPTASIHPQASNAIHPNGNDQQNSVMRLSLFSTRDATGDALVPETSPPDGFARPLQGGGLLTSSQPQIEGANRNDTTSGFNADAEKNLLLLHDDSSPIGPDRRRSARRLQRGLAARVASGFRSDMDPQSESTEDVRSPDSTSPDNVGHENIAEDESVVLASSEYVTAPDGHTWESVDGGSAQVTPVSNSADGPQSSDCLKSRPAPAPYPNGSSSHRSSPMIESTIVPTKTVVVKRAGLRPADNIRGSSRKFAQNREGGLGTIPPSRLASASVLKGSLSSSRRALEIVQEHQIDDTIALTDVKRRSPLSMQVPEGSLFKNMAFSVSYITRDEERVRVVQKITQNGGRLLKSGFNELFGYTVSRTSSSRSSPGFNDGNLSLTDEARKIGFTCLIADEHSRKAKFMQALALGLPCIAGLWIEHCVEKKQILDWEPYLLAAGESSFLDGAVRSRNLQPYSAITSKFAERFEIRQQLLAGKAILLVMAKGKAEERKKAYLFLTHALGAQRVQRVVSNEAARTLLLEAERNQEEYDWVYVDDNKEDDAEKVIFGGGSRKRKKGNRASEDMEGPPPKKVRIISDDYVIQSLILGKLVTED